jgi:hypothetical protein
MRHWGQSQAKPIALAIQHPGSISGPPVSKGQAPSQALLLRLYCPKYPEISKIKCVASLA